MKKAIIENGIVVGIVEGDIDGVPIPDLVLVDFGWRYEKEEFLPPAPKVLSFSEQLSRLIMSVAEHRYRVETAGITVNGRRINTEREAQAKLNSAFVSLQNGLIQTTDWKADDGSWVQVDLAGLKPIAAAVAQHVAACFSAEKAHQAAIAALKTQAEIDAYGVTVGWPS